MRLRSAVLHARAAWADGEIVMRPRRRHREREVPPFAMIVAEAVAPHRGNQQGAALLRVGRDAGAARAADVVEAIIAGAHVDTVVGGACRRGPGAWAVASGGVEGS